MLVFIWWTRVCYFCWLPCFVVGCAVSMIVLSLAQFALGPKSYWIILKCFGVMLVGRSDSSMSSLSTLQRRVSSSSKGSAIAFPSKGISLKALQSFEAYHSQFLRRHQQPCFVVRCDRHKHDSTSMEDYEFSVRFQDGSVHNNIRASGLRLDRGCEPLTKKLKPGTRVIRWITTGDVCMHLVKPATASRQCSFVDYLRSEDASLVGEATHFVSHAWKYDFEMVSEI